MLNFKKMFVLLLALVLLSCTVSAFADNYTVNVNFYDSDRTTSLSQDDISSSAICVYLEIKEISTGNDIGWNHNCFDPKNTTWPISFSYNGFRNLSGNAWSGIEYNYDPNLYVISSVRLFSGDDNSVNYRNIHGTTPPSEVVAGFKVEIPSLGTTSTDINLYKSEYTVNVQFLDSENKPSSFNGSSNQLYIYLELKDNETNNVVGWNYASFNPIEDAQLQQIFINFRDLENDGGWVGSYPYSFDSDKYTIANAGIYSEAPTYKNVNNIDGQNSPKAVDGYKLLSPDYSNSNQTTLKLKDSSYVVDIEFYGTDKKTLTPYTGDNTNLYLYLEITDGNDPTNIGWNIATFQPKAKTSDNNACSFNSEGTIVTCPFLKFGNISNENNQRQVNLYSDPLTFDSEQYTISRARLYSEPPTYYNVRVSDPKPDDTVDGAKFISSTVGTNKTVMKLRKWNGAHLYIDVNIDAVNPEAIAESDGYWLRAELKHTTGNPTYYVTPLTITTGQTKFHTEANQWRDNNGTVIDFEKFTGNEPTVNVEIVKVIPEEGQTQEEIAANVAKLASSITRIVGGRTVKNYAVDYADGTLTINTRKTDDYNTFYTNCVYNIYLTEAEMDEALTPEEILGEASEFGIVADTYDQSGHTETNFAVHTFKDSSNFDIDGSGDTPIPIYAGNVTDVIKLSEKTNIDVDIYVTEADKDKIESNYTHHAINKHIMTQEAINAYVDKLIRAGKETSIALASKTTITPEPTSNYYIVDTTSFPDGTTIYVNADHILNQIATGGWHINKLPNQSIVFNINAETVEESDKITIGEFYVNPNDGIVNPDGKTEIQSNTSPMNADVAKNQRVDEVILSHIFFNVPNAKKVHLDTVSALFLLPEAELVTQNNGAGWILAKGTVLSDKEWHFYRHTRSYKAKGDFTLQTQKTLIDSLNNAIPFSGKQFRFELYQTDPNGVILTDTITHEDSTTETVPRLHETILADTETGIINFHSIKYANTDVIADSTATFYYLIREIVPENAVNANNVKYKDATEEQKKTDTFTKDNIDYKASPILVRVTVKNQEKPGTTTGEREIKITNVEAKFQAEPDSGWKVVSGTEEEHPVFSLQADNANKEFTNKKTVKVTAKKVWRDADNSPLTLPAGTQVTYTLYRKVGNADPVQTSYTVTLDGTTDTVPSVTGTRGYESAPWTATFDQLPGIDSDTSSSTYGSAITYLIGEETPTGFTASPAGLVEDGTTIINTAQKVEITAQKAWVNEDNTNTPPDGASVVFLLYENGTPTEFSVTLDGTADSAPSGTGGYESTPWIAKFVNLPPFTATGDPITYTVRETTQYEDYTIVPETGVPDGGTITNTKREIVVTGNISLSATKSITSWPADNREFTFTLSGLDNSSSNQGNAAAKLSGFTTEQKTKNATNTARTVTFGPISFGASDIGKEFTFRITETEPPGTDTSTHIYQGVTYDQGYHSVIVKPQIDTQTGAMTFDVTVVDNNSQHQTVPSGGTVENAATITNTYNASGTATINVQKALGNSSSWPTTPANVRFTLSPDTEKNTVGTTVPMPSVAYVDLSNEQKNGSIGPINFSTDAGNAGKTYYYKLTEDGFGAGWISSGPINVEITVGQDTGIDTLTTTVNYPSGQEFFTITNTKVTGAGLQFKATKSMKEGHKWPEDREFNIIMEPDGNTKISKIKQPVKENQPYAIFPSSSEAITFTGEEAERGAEFKFKIYEENHGQIIDGVTHASNEISVIVKPTLASGGVIELSYSLDNGKNWPKVKDNIIEVGNFVNEYTATGTSVTFSGTKELTGKAMKNEQFHFNIKNTDNVTVGTCTNDATGKITCKPINYTLADAGITYTYTVTEDLDGVDPTTHKKNGITYDFAKSYKVSVTVTDNGNGTITATPSENYNKLNFTNSYTATGAVQFKAKKELKNGTLTANQFSFKLSKPDGSSETVENDAQGNVVFPKISYTLEDLKKTDGTYETTKDFVYTIEEIVPKTLTGSVIVYDNSKYTVTVTVTDNGAGTLNTGISVKDADDNTVSTSYTTDTDGTHIFTLGKSFTNSKIQPVTVPLSASKKLVQGSEEKTPTADQVWDFTLEALDGGPLPSADKCPRSGSSTTSCTVRNNSGSIDFGTISFDHTNLGGNQGEKEYKYQITETLRTTKPKSPDNISPDPNEKIIFVKLSLVNGALTAEVSEEVNSQRKTITPSDGKYNIGEFTNIYVADGSILFEATKAFKKDGKDVSWPNGAEIELVLAAKNQTAGDPAYEKLNALDTKTKEFLKQEVSYGKEKAAFPILSFSRSEAQAKTQFDFVISETKGTNTAITYDETKQYVRVIPKIEAGQVKLQVSVSTDGTTYTDKTADITENSLNVGTFINEYTASGSLKLSAKKLINVWPKGAKFEFSIRGNDDKSAAKIANFANAIAEDEDHPLAKFAAIQFDQFDIGQEFTFTIREVDQSSTNRYLTYSTKTVTVKVSVADHGDGTLDLTVTPNKLDEGSQSYIVGEFENVYKAEGTLNLKARKIVIGADETYDESHTFHFILRYNDAGETETHHKVTGTVTTTKDGEYASINWQPIIYKLTDKESDVSADQTDLQWLIDKNKAIPGKTDDEKNKWTVNYMLEEDTTANETEENEDVDIDHHHLPVTITIIDNGNGTLSCTQEGLDTTIPTFTNHEVHDGSVTISAKKELNGRALTDADKWTFTLAQHSSNPDAPMPEICSTTATSCAPQNNNKGEVKFPPIHFTFEDLDLDNIDVDDLENKNGKITYKYTITESGGGFAGVTNDSDLDREFSITLWLVRDAQGVESLQFKVEDEKGNVINRITETGTNLFNTYPAATFVNKYEAGGTVKLAVTKSMQGDIWPFNGEFEFEITEDTNNQPMKYKGTSTVKVRKPETGKTSTAEFTGFDYFTQDDINKQFTYTIKEENGGTTANGVSYSGEEYTIVITPKPDGNYIKPEVKVTSKLQKGEVQPISITSDGEGTYSIVAGNFENSYTASGTAELKATKALAEGSTWPAGKSVTFTLSDVSENQYKPAPLPKKDGVETTELSVSKAGEISFGTLTFGYNDIGKTFKYEIKETQGFGAGWAPSDPITATVTVNGDKGDGTLDISSITYTHDDTITNTYSLSGKGEIKVQKVLNGREWTSEDSFTFTLSGPPANPWPAKKQIIITQGNDDHTETFGEINFTKEGTYHYVVQEIRDSIGGITYDAKEYDVDFTVKDDGKGHLIADGTPLIQTVVITNTYNATGRLLLNSSKQITNTDGDTTESHKIPFELWYKGDHDKYLAGDTVKPLISNEVTIYDGSTTTFDYPIRYTLAKLTRPTDPGNPKEGEDGSYVTETVTVDGKKMQKRFKLVSLPNLKDTEKAQVSQDGKTWTVEYVLDEKTVVDQQLKPPDQTFNLTVTIADDGKGSLKVTKILEKNINTGETKDIPVTNAENGTNVGQFVNVERKDAEPITVSGAKTMEGRALTAADNNIWKAVLSVEPKDGPMPASSEVMIAVADGKGSYSFGPIPFTAKDLGTCRTSEMEKYTCDPKIYTYTVKEGYVSDANRPGGVTNDTTAKTFSVRVSLDTNGDVQAQLVRLDEEGKVTKVISAEELLSDLTFTNKYDATGSLALNVTKEMRGGWPAHVRSFDVTIEGETDEAKAKLSEPTTIVFTSGGQSLKFGPFNFKLEDKGEEFTYLVKEIVPAEAVNGSYQGVRYDLRKYRVVITPVDGGNGNLAFDYQILDADTGAPFDEGRNVPSGTVIDLESFTNTYYQVSVQFGGRKTLNGRKLENAEFSFRLLDAEGNLLELVRNNGAGNFSFSPIYFTEDQIGTYTYTVRETAGSEDGMIYDETEYHITVKVSKNIFGELIIEASEESGTPLDALNFENEYHIVFYRITPGVPTLPETGFSAVRPQALPEKPLSVNYKPLSWTLQIPTLDVITEIVEVPSQDGTYPVTWLGYDAGLLEGYAMPGEGPTVITGHNHLNTTEAGPFALIQQMEIGDRIFVTDENNEIQIFQVYANEKIDETDFAGLNRIVESRENSLTMLTCEDERPNGGYQNRRIIAAAPVNGK